MLKEYKIFAGNMIVESDNTKEVKNQLLDFIKSASDPQVKNFILNGTVMENVKKDKLKDINEQFEKAYIEEGVLKSIFGMFLLSPPGWVMYRAIRATFSKASRKCGALSIGKIRDICLLRCKVTKYQKLIRLITGQMKNCTSSKNPSKCKQKGADKLGKWKEELGEVLARIKDVQSSGPKVRIKQEKE